MRFVCPSCAIEYEVDPAQLGASGRMVVCGACDAEWFQGVEKSAPSADEPAESAEETLSAPEKTKEASRKSSEQPSKQTPIPVKAPSLKKAGGATSGEAAPLYGRASGMPHSVGKNPGPEAAPVTPRAVAHDGAGKDASAIKAEPGTIKPKVSSVEKPEAAAGSADGGMIFAPAFAARSDEKAQGPETPKAPVTPKVPTPATPKPVEEARGKDAAQTDAQTDAPAEASTGKAAVADIPPGPASEAQADDDRLRAPSEPKDEVDILAASIMEDEAPSYRSAHGAFVGGFALVMLVGIILTVVYVKAPDIITLAPVLDGPIGAYAEAVDRVRVGLLTLMAG